MKPLTDGLYHSLPSRGWLDREEAELLYRAAQWMDGPILEVGCYHGRSTCLLASLGRLMYCVDPFAGFDTDDPDGTLAREGFEANLEGRGFKVTEVGWVRTAGRVRLFHGPISRWIPHPVGFAYLDSDHTYEGTKDQIRVAVTAQAEVVAVHDVNDSGGGLEVKKACLACLGQWVERAGRLAVWRLA